MEQHVIAERVDHAVGVVALLLRACAYALVANFAGHYDCGHAVLTGLLVGDLAASLTLLVMHRECLAQAASEVVLMLLVFLWVRHDLVWPEPPALRAIVGLAALGVFAPRVGGGALTRIGHD